MELEQLSQPQGWRHQAEIDIGAGPLASQGPGAIQKHRLHGGVALQQAEDLVQGTSRQPVAGFADGGPAHPAPGAESLEAPGPGAGESRASARRAAARGSMAASNRSKAGAYCSTISRAISRAMAGL